MQSTSAAASVRDNEREALVAAAVRSARPIAVRTRVAAINAYKAGASVTAAVTDALMRERAALENGCLAAHLQGRLRAAVTARAARGEALSLDAFGSAIDWLTKRLKLTGPQIVDLADEYADPIDAAINLLAGDINEHVADALVDIGRKGLHTQGGIAAIRDAFDAAGMGPQKDSALETMYRTQMAGAYGAGQWHANQSPEIAEILWGYEYATAGDDRVRPTHAAMDGVRAPKEDPLWQTWWCPCGYNCRCVNLEIYHGAEEAVAVPPLPLVEIDGATVVPGPDNGFGFNTGEMLSDVLQLVRL
jgi:SPP1 gp7 family putative phage head morphogenesis protein